MSDQSLNIFSLETAKKLLTSSVDLQTLKPAEVSFISKAHNLFLNYYSKIHPESVCPPEYEDLDYFTKNLDSKELDAITSYLSNSNEGDQEEKTRELKKEDTSIPVELEAMVAMYKQHQADLVDNEKPNSLAENIKRAQKTVNEIRKRDLIYENASEERQKELDRQQEKSDQIYSQTVDPKKTRSELTQNTRDLAAYLVLSQSKNLNTDQYKEAIEQIVSLAENSGIDISDKNSLYDISYSIVNSYTKENQKLEDIRILAEEQLKAEELGLDTDEYNKKIASLAESVEEEENKKDKDNKSNRDKFSEKFSDKNPDPDKSIPDPDVLIGESQKEVNNITQKLSKRFPNAKNPYQETDFLAQNAKAIEKAILATDRTALSPIPVGLGARTAATLKETGSNALNPVIVDLYSRGLTEKKFKELEADKKSEVAKLSLNQRKGIRNGLRMYGKSPDGIEISKHLKPISRIESYLPTSVQKALHPVKTIEAELNKRIGSYAGKKIRSVFGKELGPTLEKYILKDGIKKFANETTAKLITAGAKKLGLQTAKVAGAAAAKAAGASALAAASAALGISTAGLSLIIEAAIFIGAQVISFGYNKFKEVYKSVFNEDFDGKKALGSVALGGLALWGMLNTGKKGLEFAAVATKAAVISAVGIIWLSIATIAIFLTLTFLVAPILSTLVQFDSVEKVQYEAPSTDEPLSCANTKGIFVSQRNPKWSGTFCKECSKTGFCNIGGSGCGSASMTMILNSFGIKDNVTNVWNKQHSIGGYQYTSIEKPYMGCQTDNNKSLNILKSRLAVTDIGVDWREGDKALKSCGLILASGSLKCSNPDGCGHLLVIIAHNGNNITTMDPWSGENFVHTLNNSFVVSRMWKVTR